MDQSGKCLLFNHEDLSLIPSIHAKKETHKVACGSTGL